MWLLTVFSGPYALLARWAVLAIACAALWGHGWFKGNEHGTEKLTEYIGKQVTASVKLQERQAVVSERVVKQYVDRVQTIKEKGEQIEKLVPIYITAQNDAACHVNNGYVRLHNASATNTVPPSPNATDASASGLTLSTSLAIVTANYTTYHQTAARLSALQQWVREQYKATNGEELK